MNNANQSPFGLVAKEDPDRLKAIRLREEVCDDPDLSDGAVRLFVRLLDLSLNKELYHGHKGQVIASQLALASFIKCTERSIRRRVAQLVQKLLIWITVVPRPSTKPILCYHITAFQPKQQKREEVPGDGFWGNGRRRYDSGFLSKSKEHLPTGNDAGRKRRKGFSILDQFGNPVSSDLLKNTPDRGLEEPVSSDKIDRSERTQASSVSGHNRPLREDSNVRSERSKATAHSGQKRPLTEAGSGRLKESQYRDSVSLERVRDSAPQNTRAVEEQKHKAVEVAAFVTQQDLVWKERLAKKFDPELLRIQEGLKKKLKKAQMEDQPILRWRIQAVEETFFGPTPAGERAAALLERPTRSARSAHPATPKTSPAEFQRTLLTSARTLITAGPLEIVTEGMALALASAGDPIPEHVYQRHKGILDQYARDGKGAAK